MSSQGQIIRQGQKGKTLPARTFKLKGNNTPPAVTEPIVRRSLATTSYILDENVEDRIMCQVNKGEPFCIFAFGKNCSPPGQLLVGGLCAHHNKSCLNRLFVEMASMHETSITSVCQSPAKMKTTFPLVTMIPFSYSIDQIKMEIMRNKTSLDPGDAHDIATLYYILAQPDSTMLNDSTATQVKTYLNQLMAQHYESLNQDSPRMKNIKVIHICSPEYANLMQNNQWHLEILEKHCVSEDENSICTVFPLSKLSFIDMLILRGFHINSIPGKLGYEPNWGLYNGQLVCGLGYGFNNVMDSIKNQTEEKRNKIYRPRIREIINKAKLPLTMNLDVGTLSTVIDETSDICHASEMPLEVSEHHRPLVNLDISQVKFAC